MEVELANGATCMCTEYITVDVILGTDVGSTWVRGIQADILPGDGKELLLG